MKVILREDVKDLGIMGTVIDVANGYGRNYLIPQNIAVEANTKNIKRLEHEKNIILAKAKKIRKSAEDAAEELSKLSITIEAKSGEEDKLFGSVTTKDIAEEIAKQGIDVDKRKIILDEPIKHLGSYEVVVKIHHDVTAKIKLEVTKAGSEDTEE
jgi:large subunit ribosomal protein L9